MAPYIGPLPSTSNVSPIAKMEELIAGLCPNTSSTVKQNSNQVVEDLASIAKEAKVAKEARWNKTLARDYCNEMNGIFDSFEKNRDVPSTQLHAAFHASLRVINSSLLTAKYALDACPSLQPASRLKCKKVDLLLHSIAMVEQKYRDLKQIFKDLSDAKEENILHSRFRTYLDDSVTKAIDLTKIAYKLSKNSVAFLKRVSVNPT